MSLTPQQMNAMIATDRAFAALVQVHGVPVAVVDCTAASSNPGDICMEGNCVNGKKLVMRCDQNNGCTVYDTVPC
jgi:hypothetical protein